MRITHMKNLKKPQKYRFFIKNRQKHKRYEDLPKKGIKKWSKID